MANVETNSSKRNILYQIPELPEISPNNNVQEQLPQTTNSRQKKAEAVLAARLDFVHVFEPWAFRENEKPKYSVTLIISKNDTDTIRKVHNALDQAYENGKSTLQNAEMKDIHSPLRDGDVERPDNPAYRNCWFINATNNGIFSVPQVCDRDKNVITDRNQLYSGVWGRVHVSFKAYSGGNSPSQKGIGCYFNVIQKTKDDARIVPTNPFAVFN